jgi:hypothetical protein
MHSPPLVVYLSICLLRVAHCTHNAGAHGATVPAITMMVAVVGGFASLTVVVGSQR